MGIFVNSIRYPLNSNPLYKTYPLRNPSSFSYRVSKKPTMATSSISVITSSLASLSFSSQISQNFQLSSLCFSKSLSLPKNSSLVISASAVTAPSPVDIETEDLKTLVKSRLPGGFAAQTIFGTGRRKAATARVVLQEGTGKIIINYRDAKVLTFCQSIDFTIFIYIKCRFRKLLLLRSKFS